MLLMTLTMQTKLSMNCKTYHDIWVSSDGLHDKLFVILTGQLTVFRCSYFKAVFRTGVNCFTTDSASFVLFDRRLSSICPSISSFLTECVRILADCY